MSSVLITSTMKSDPGMPLTRASSRGVPVSASAALPEGGSAEGALGACATRSAERAGAIAVAAPAATTPVRSLRRSALGPVSLRVIASSSSGNPGDDSNTLRTAAPRPAKSGASFLRVENLATNQADRALRAQLTSVEPFAPVTGSTVRVRHSDEQNAGFVRVIDQAIGKPAQAATTNALAERMPGVGKLPDPFDCCDRLQQKRIAQAGDLTVVVRNRFVELPLSDFENADVSLPAVLRQHLFQRNRLDLAAAISGETVLGLLRPELVDIRIGLVETRQDVVHELKALRRRELARLPAQGLSCFGHCIRLPGGRFPADSTFGPRAIRMAIIIRPCVSRAKPLQLHALVGEDALHRGALRHAVLERAVVFKLRHGQLAPLAPGVEHQGVGIEHRVFVGQPLDRKSDV